MSLDKSDTLAIADLARLALSDAEAERLTIDLNCYLQWIERLQNIETDGCEPLTSVSEHALPLREDVVSDGDIADKILGCGEQVKRVGEGGFFVVPKVVE